MVLISSSTAKGCKLSVPADLSTQFFNITFALLKSRRQSSGGQRHKVVKLGILGGKDELSDREILSLY